MPELPEVETVRAGLEKIFKDQPRVERARLLRADIRFPIPRELPRRMAGQSVYSVRRRAKYLLFDTAGVTLLSHLGMTGSWRLINTNDPPETHDHFLLDLEGGKTLVFRDPRRFGIIDLIEPGLENEHPRLHHLGPEPLDENAFTGESLFLQSRKRIAPIKAMLMDQRIVVGIGNIYASEAFFRAGILPTKRAGRLTLMECERLVESSRAVLRAALASGGSSIRDYRQAGGEKGGFQDQHVVYDRAGEPCVVCHTSLKSKVIAGRSTFWCRICQH